MACKGRQGGFGVLPRTGQGFLESVRPWMSGRHSCFYGSHAVASLHPSVGPKRAPQELHNRSSQDNFQSSQPRLPASWLRREEGGSQEHQDRQKKKACVKGYPAPPPRAQRVTSSRSPEAWRSPLQRTPEVTDRGRRLAFVGGINALPSPSGDFWLGA